MSLCKVKAAKFVYDVVFYQIEVHRRLMELNILESQDILPANHLLILCILEEK